MSRLIAGGGFAVMAWELANNRAYPHMRSKGGVPAPRHRVQLLEHYFPASVEYYRIIDAAEYATQHDGMHSYGPTVKL